MEERNFTLSYSLEAQNWVFFHDYIPGFYFHTREKLYNLKRQEFYEHNLKDTYGSFYPSPEGADDAPNEVKPCFIDVVFRTDGEYLLETVNWISSVLENKVDTHDRDSEWNTLTHISIWNSQQHTGRIPLNSIFTDLQYRTSRGLNGSWSMNDFRNILNTRGVQFLNDLFKDYALDSAYAANKPWYDAELLQDKYMVVRFEFDNSMQKQLILHDLSVQGQKTSR
jgi:hypothetical protein